jgi:hypothetical protein
MVVWVYLSLLLLLAARQEPHLSSIELVARLLYQDEELTYHDKGDEMMVGEEKKSY